VTKVIYAAILGALAFGLIWQSIGLAYWRDVATGKRGTPTPVKTAEYGWLHGMEEPSGYHWECPVGWAVFWPEVNIVTGAEIAPICARQNKAAK
jgi:hypothetical protein